MASCWIPHLLALEVSATTRQAQGASLLWLGVTAHPTAEWITQQFTEACGWESPPNYLIRDRDRVYGEAFTRRIRAMGIRDRPTAPRSPWQNGYAERFIGSVRRECLDHVIVFGEQHLRRVLRSYQQYYNGTRTHLSLAKDAPLPRAIQTVGSILPLPVLGGLHHHYVRIKLTIGTARPFSDYGEPQLCAGQDASKNAATRAQAGRS